MADKGLKFARDYGLLTVSASIINKGITRKLIMVVDTGAYLTLIKPEIAELLNVAEADICGRMQISSPIGSEQGYKTKVGKFQIGDHTQNNFLVGVIRLHDSYGVDGLLGLNFLENYNFAVNFVEEKIYLEKLE